jgi:hypothetical protein
MGTIEVRTIVTLRNEVQPVFDKRGVGGGRIIEVFIIEVTDS